MQFKKGNLSILCKDFDITILLRLVQFLKARFPNVTTESGITISSRFVQ